MNRKSVALQNLHLKAVFLIFCAFIFSCSGDKKQSDWKNYEQMEDCYLDSLTVKDYLSTLKDNFPLSEPLQSFYSKRNFVPVWIGRKGPNEFAGNLMNLLNNEEKSLLVKGDSLLNVLHEMHREVLSYSGDLCQKDSLALKFEILLTMNFFEYADRNWGGAGDDVLKKVNWFIERKRLNYEQLLGNFLKIENPRFINEPVYEQYGLMKKFLKKYFEIEMLGGWARLPGEKIKIIKGDSSPILPLIRQQLFVLGDLDDDNRISFYDDELEIAMKKFQRRHGLDEDGVIGGKTIQALNVPVQARIEQLLINMERCRWVPIEIKGDYILVNIPQFKMQVYTDNKPDWSCNVIVGKSNEINNTVIFNDSIEHIVFNPYWNIPKNIMTMETLPMIKKDGNYLRKNNLEVVDRNGKQVMPFMINWSQYTDHFPYIIRERPGISNSLGRVKFLFPNPYDIYLHDTPAKTLFQKSSRAFSHGCIRLEEPLKLAAHLLRNQQGWDTARINKVIATEKESYVKLKKKVPVFLTYFTAWVDTSGEINFREDVYDHDKKMRDILIVN